MNEYCKDLLKEQTAGKPVRVALITPGHIISEYSTFLEHLLMGLADESVPMALVCPADCNVESLVSPGVEILKYPHFGFRFLEHQSRKVIIEGLLHFKPTVLHCLDESDAMLTSQLARQLELPYVLTVNSLQNRLSRFRFSSKRLAKITVPAKSILENVCEIYPGLSERIEQINIGAFAGEEINCFNKPGQLVSMVVVDELTKESRFVNLFSAVKRLVLSGYEFMLVVMGNGKAEGKLRELVGAMELSQTIVIVPRLKPCQNVIKAGDIFIRHQPSDILEPLLIEAMSAGTAVAGCKGGVDDLLVEEQTCVVFAPNDEISIMKGLQSFLDKKDFAQQMALRAQNYIRENHTVSKMVDSFLRIYRQEQDENSIVKAAGA